MYKPLTHNAVLSLPIALLPSQLSDPRYRNLLLEYAGEMAAPSVAEAFMSFLRRENSSRLRRPVLR